MIPRIIHYCWFGRSEKNALVQKCIESWKKLLPDYELIEWNEDNFDINSTIYTKQAYDMRKWAFVSDYVRLYALYSVGGFYFDTDVEVLKRFDTFQSENLFSGYESKDSPVTAVMGAEKGQRILKELLDHYVNNSFLDNNGKCNLTTNTLIITKYLIANGLLPNGKKQTINGMTIYPQIYFCPNNFSRIWNKPSHKSYTIHHFDQSWRLNRREFSSLTARLRRYLVGNVRNIIGTTRIIKIKNFFIRLLKPQKK